MLENNEDEHDDGQCYDRVQQAIADKKSHPINEIVHRFDQERVHLAISDIRRYLPLIVSRRD
jgi:hypothetical protein